MGIGKTYLNHTSEYCLNDTIIIGMKLLLKLVNILSYKIIMSTIDNFIDIICCLKIIKISGRSRIKLAINFII